MAQHLLPLAFLDVGTPELLLIFLAILILFGGQRLPELARGLGKSVREFKKASAGVEEEIKRAIESTPESEHTAKPVLPKEPPATASAAPASPTLAAHTEPRETPKT